MKNPHELSGNALIYQNVLFKLIKHTITNESSLNINTSLPKATQKIFKEWSVETIYFFLETCKLLPWNDEEQKKRYFEPNKLQQFNNFVALKTNEGLKKELEAVEKLKKETTREGEEEIAKLRKEQEAKEEKLRREEEKQKIMAEEAAKRAEAIRNQQRLQAEQQCIQQRSL